LNLGLHSKRSGGATAVVNTNIDERCWKRHGRWKSDTSKDGYIVDSVTSRLEVTKKLRLFILFRSNYHLVLTMVDYFYGFNSF
jgi:hypothetical protein